MMTPSKLDIVWQWKVPYSETLEWQIQRREKILSGEAKEALLLVEHPPTITLGKRGGVVHNVPADTVVHQIHRGGLATWHGPGQMVMYPIINLNKRGLGIRSFVCILENSVLDVLQYLSHTGHRQSQPGIWVSQQKIAALGLDVRKGITIHGASLNIDVDPTRFNSIDPCGASEIRITSIHSQLDCAPNLLTVGKIWKSYFLKRLQNHNI